MENNFTCIKDRAGCRKQGHSPVCSVSEFFLQYNVLLSILLMPITKYYTFIDFFYQSP